MMDFDKSFFTKDCLDTAPLLVGKKLCRRLDDGTVLSLRITETECYRGEEDTACHASKGRTARTETLYAEGGTIYVYLCYGMHWLINFVTGEKDFPQAVLIRSAKIYDGPGKLTKHLQIDKSFNGEKIYGNKRIWLENDLYIPQIESLPRVGINYATEYYRNVPWRFKDKNS